VLHGNTASKIGTGDQGNALFFRREGYCLHGRIRLAERKQFAMAGIWKIGDQGSGYVSL